MGQWCPLSFWQQLPEQVMAAYGLIETYRYERRPDDLELIDAMLDRVNPALESLGLYLDELTHLQGTLYGPTTLTAAAAVLNLRYALQVGGPRGAERAEYGLRVIDAVNEAAYDAERGIYRFSVAADQLHLYPNAMMIIANCLAYEATEDTRYLERARATFENMQPLKDPRQGNYRSPYSAASAGTRTEDYSTLSSQLYLIGPSAYCTRAPGKRIMSERPAACCALCARTCVTTADWSITGSMVGRWGPVNRCTIAAAATFRPFTSCGT